MCCVGDLRVLKPRAALPVSAPSLTLMNVKDFNQWIDDEPQILASFQIPPPLPFPSSRLVHSLFGSRTQKCNSISNCQSLVFCLIKYVTSSHLRSCFNSLTLSVQSRTKVDILCSFSRLRS